MNFIHLNESDQQSIAQDAHLEPPNDNKGYQKNSYERKKRLETTKETEDIKDTQH